MTESNVFPGLGPDRVVLITAGASGIGREMAVAFSQCGCQVMVCDVDGDALAELQAAHPAIGVMRADVSDSDQVAAVFSALEQRYGALHVLVNNAGIAGPSLPVEDIDPDDWRQTLAVDLDSVFYCMRLAVPLLKVNGGSVVNMSSSAARYPCPNRSPYVAAKAAILGLTQSWALELGPSGIRVNAVCPGSVEGPRLTGVIERDAAQRGVEAEEVASQYREQSAMGVMMQACDVVELAMFLASDRARYINGECIGVDGLTRTLDYISK